MQKIHGTLVVDTAEFTSHFFATLYMVVAALWTFSQWLAALSLSSICACLRRNVGILAFLQTIQQPTEHLTQTGNQASRHPRQCPWRDIKLYKESKISSQHLQ